MSMDFNADGSKFLNQLKVIFRTTFIKLKFDSYFKHKYENCESKT